MRYTPDGGLISIRTYLDGHYGVVEVSDTGIGIPESDLPRIFERFYRADNAGAFENSGTGLGLAIVRKIVEMHGGRVVVRSALGRGSAFRVYLPITQPEVVWETT